jgi:hypothetical protein
MDDLLEVLEPDDIIAAVAAFARNAAARRDNPPGAGHEQDPWSTIARWGR